MHTLPKPPPLGKANWTVGDQKAKVPTGEDPMYADSVGVLFDIERDKLTVVYSDKMTLIWDMKNR